MKWLSGLLLPIGLGCAAAFLNFMAIRVGSETDHTPLVVLKEDLAPGAAFRPEAIGRLDVPGDPEALKRTFVPFGEREAALQGVTATRKFAKGELVTWRDVHPPEVELQPALGEGEAGLNVPLAGLACDPALLLVGNDVGFALSTTTNPGAAVPTAAIRYAGPFRIVGVGRRVRRDAGDFDERTNTPQHITVAVKLNGKDFDETTRNLIEALDRRTVKAIVLHKGGARQ